MSLTQRYSFALASFFQVEEENEALRRHAVANEERESVNTYQQLLDRVRELMGYCCCHFS